MSIKARLVPGTADDAIRHSRVRAPSRIATAIRLIIELGKGQIQERTPVGWSGALRGGYATEMRGQGGRHPRGIISNPTLYHDVREEGRRPGKRPPVAALIPWVGSKLGVAPEDRAGVAFLVARKIGARGYEGAHMVDEGWTATRRQVQPILTKMGLEIVRDIR